MASDTELRRKYRTAVMAWIFDTANGTPEAFLMPQNYPGHHELGMDPDERDAAVEYLLGEGLITLRGKRLGNGKPYLVGLTHTGIVEFEKAQSNPTVATPHLVPLVQINGDVTGSAINVVTGNNNTVIATVTPPDTDFAKFIIEARSRLGGLDETMRMLAESSLREMETELASSNPQPSKLRAIGQAAIALITGGLGGTAGDGLSALLGIS